MTRIPKPIASAMLAGILLPICLAPVQASVGRHLVAGAHGGPGLAVLARLAPRWAVPAAVVATAVVVAIATGGNPLAGQSIAPTIRFVLPSIEPAVLISLGVPLYIVTMAGQNVPGFAVLRTFGYDQRAGARDPGRVGRGHHRRRAVRRLHAQPVGDHGRDDGGTGRPPRPVEALDHDGDLGKHLHACWGSERARRPLWSRPARPS